ncbi:hypothetical protein [Cytobacillus firmus]|nr:hypothetical protein [Cytobacillus firmus]MCU1808338.1 hypothetical protein [Cytobacillus firmus]
MSINTSLSTFMKIAITVVVISAFIYGAMFTDMSILSDSIADYITNSG